MFPCELVKLFLSPWLALSVEFCLYPLNPARHIYICVFYRFCHVVGIVPQHTQSSEKREGASPRVSQTQDLHGNFALSIDEVNLAGIRRRQTKSFSNDSVHKGNVVLTREWQSYRHDGDKGEIGKEEQERQEEKRHETQVKIS